MKKILFIGTFSALLAWSNLTVAFDFPFFPQKNEEASSASNATQEGESSNSWSSVAQEVILQALGQTGVKYKYGGINPDSGFDCSGFVRYVFKEAANLTLPHGARAMSQVGKNVSEKELQPGDLVFFNTMKSVYSHVGIYVGNNRFIHAPSAGSSISVSDMNDSYWSKRYTGARRIDEKELARIESIKPAK
ncbi:MAG: C40 family peptidase [Candidatus Methylopumilus sp.]|nr:C40 family peptidase [Candidatus Methylopumilus sp.]